ncbi:hypothetical protein WA158_003237 [Blastocystis sp. Blastoise]
MFFRSTFNKGSNKTNENVKLESVLNTSDDERVITTHKLTQSNQNVTPLHVLPLNSKDCIMTFYFKNRTKKYEIEQSNLMKHASCVLAELYFDRKLYDQPLEVDLDDDDDIFEIVINYLRTNRLITGRYSSKILYKLYNSFVHYKIDIPLQLSPYNVDNLILSKQKEKLINYIDQNNQVYTLSAELFLNPSLSDCLLRPDNLYNLVYDIDYDGFHVPGSIHHMSIITDYLLYNCLPFENVEKSEIKNILLDFKSLNIPLDESKIDTTISINFKESQLMNSYEAYKLNSWCPNKQWSLLFRASRDGYQASRFHKYCDNRGETLTLIKVLTKDSYSLFGGYTSISWSSTYEYIRDPSSFIFSLHTPNQTNSMVFPCRGKGNTIKHDKKAGPIFGNLNYDIYIDNKCNESESSFFEYSPHDDSNGYVYIDSFNLSHFCDSTIRSEWTGNKYLFKVYDYEVYHIESKH